MSDRAETPRRRHVARMATGWLAVIHISAGAAVLFFLQFVVPASSESWAKMGIDPPEYLAWLLEYRWLLTASAAIVFAAGLGAILFARNAVVRLGTLLICLLILLFAAAGGLLLWWIMYAEAIRGQME